MLLGQIEGRIDEKFRIAFPKTFREILGGNLIVTKGFEKSLIVVSQGKWQSLLEGTEGLPFTTKAARETQRFLLGGAAFVTLDSKGRFILPSYLREFGELSEVVMFVGMQRFVELWDKKRWEDYNSVLSISISSIADRLAKKDPGTSSG